jgi:hypothetical protein
MSSKTVTTCSSHSFEPGDTIITPIHNRLRKIIWHWIFQIPLKREEHFEITDVTETTMVVK